MNVCVDVCIRQTNRVICFSVSVIHIYVCINICRDTYMSPYVILQSHRVQCDCNKYTLRPRIMIVWSILPHGIEITRVVIDRILGIDISLHL